jgi:peptide chain release factor subunit 1
MKNSGILNKLSNTDAPEFPFISVYLNAEANAHGRDDFQIFLKKQLSERENDFEEESKERESFERDVRRISEYAEKIDPAANGVAIFACAGANDFFKTVEFNVPFPNNRFFVFDRPHIYPLARLMDQNPRFAVVLADTNAAFIYVFQRGRVLNQEEIQNEKTNRSEVGGWSQMRFQRHNDELHQKHVKEVIEALAEIVREDDIQQIILAGNEEVVIPLLREELSKELEERIVDTLRMDIKTPEKEILEAAERAISQFDTLKDKEKIDFLKEQNYADGFGVTGVAETLKALQNGQVQELYLSAGFDEIEYDEAEVKKILEAYAPGSGEDETLPNVKQARQIADLLIKHALETADDIRFIEDENLLKQFGGAGALLRYKMSANQKV